MTNIELHSKHAVCPAGHELILINEGVGYCNSREGTTYDPYYWAWHLAHLSDIVQPIYGTPNLEDIVANTMAILDTHKDKEYYTALVALPTYEELYGHSL